MARTRRGPTAQQIQYDVHCHLVPAADDGVRDIDEALEAIAVLIRAGYRGAVGTPHIWRDAFDNSEDALRLRFDQVQKQARSKHPGFRLQLGAEYMFDDELLQRLYADERHLLTFGAAEPLLLVEFPMIIQPPKVEEFIGECARQKIRPIIAHVERYQYVRIDDSLPRKWQQAGALLQMNLGSVAGQYGAGVRRQAQKLWRGGLIDLIGSDLHHPSRDARHISKAWKILKKRDVGFTPRWHHQLFAG